jgi:hypothetical protein
MLDPQVIITDEKIRQCSLSARGLWVSVAALWSAGKPALEHDVHASLGIEPLDLCGALNELVKIGAAKVEKGEIRLHKDASKKAKAIDISPEVVAGIYELYPCKRSRPQALKAIEKAIRAVAREKGSLDLAADHVRERTEAFSKLWADIPAGKCVPPRLKGPAPFFNQHCFDDPEEQWPRPDRDLLKQTQYERDVQRAHDERERAAAKRQESEKVESVYEQERRTMVADIKSKCSPDELRSFLDEAKVQPGTDWTANSGTVYYIWSRVVADEYGF